MQPTLLILAAGMGSRYGGIKQLDQFGPNGETIIDYSLFDAIRAGFGKVVFIIREELRADFEEIFLPKLAGKMEVDFAIQALGSYVPADLGAVTRSKPWGTGHAMLCAREQTDTAFAVINADDFYGPEAFQILADFLKNDTNDELHALVGYEVKNTLSEFGSVSRGVCTPDASGNLVSVIERTKIYEKDGEIVFEEGDTLTPLAPETPVSMNFWGFKNAVFPYVQAQFEAYARANFDAPKAEFYIPTVMTNLIEQHQGQCKVFRSQSAWFGVTYPEDKPMVQASLKQLHDEGKYPEKLW
ncbi:nucleotidyltransferase family protein [Arsenicibacter rosenii]|uniref:Nucleotidyltransferase n=1 Tax=Arsenicibacter rosenii TaxID=1750698 RepID=A0A1S2VN60_9BACT|nr:sugar phosphate nucleotidyltransferase [Arsenicibacter rosenii]OIN59645.1 nucleotidyltransferase [Arsenicibacter rosenii]